MLNAKVHAFGFARNAAFRSCLQSRFVSSASCRRLQAGSLRSPELIRAALLAGSVVKAIEVNCSYLKDLPKGEASFQVAILK
jgi:hypothetical protein